MQNLWPPQFLKLLHYGIRFMLPTICINLHLAACWSQTFKSVILSSVAHYLHQSATTLYIPGMMIWTWVCWPCTLGTSLPTCNPRPPDSSSHHSTGKFMIIILKTVMIVILDKLSPIWLSLWHFATWVLLHLSIARLMQIDATIIAEFNGNVASIIKMTGMLKSIVIERF